MIFVVLQNADEFGMLLALPCGHDHVDIIVQSRTLEIGFITYLQQKQAAGIVNVALPGSPQVCHSQPLYVYLCTQGIQFLANASPTQTATPP